MGKTYRSLNVHAASQARDARAEFGWRYSPRHTSAGKSTGPIHVGDSAQPDLTSGMTCTVLRHSHPELVASMRKIAVGDHAISAA